MVVNHPTDILLPVRSIGQTDARVFVPRSNEPRTGPLRQVGPATLVA